MKKVFLGVMMAFAVATTIHAQQVDFVTYKGLCKVLHCHKVMYISCREQNAGYIDSNQVKATHTSKYMSRMEYHAKSAYEKFNEVVNEGKTRKAAEVSASVSYGAASGSAKASYEAEYINKVTSTVKSSGENAKDEIDEHSQEFQIEYDPHKAIQLYETVVSIPGEYERVFASAKRPDTTIIIPYEIVLDYTKPVNMLYQKIKDTHVGADKGEWDLFNQIADQAFNSRGTDQDAVLSRFLNRLNKELWSSSSDTYSWAVVKEAASAAAGQSEAVNQFLHFCSELGKIEHPSHNDWAWDGIKTYANIYNN